MFKNNPEFLLKSRLVGSIQNAGTHRAKERLKNPPERLFTGVRAKIGVEEGGANKRLSHSKRGRHHSMGGSGSTLLPHIGKKKVSFQ